MKRPLITLALVGVMSSAAADDIRVVSGVSVNLTPVKKWLKSGKGERPLKHWQRLIVQELHGQGGGGDRCIVRNEDGEDREVIVANLPAGLKTILFTINQQAANITALRAWISNADKAAKYADAITPTGASGRPEYVDAVMAERARVNLQVANVEEAKDRLSQLENDHEVLKAKRDAASEILAMLSRKVGRFEVWDCGRVKPN